MSHPLFDRILSGKSSSRIKLAGARGALPLPREELITLWVLLRADQNPEVRLACKESLANVSEKEWLEILPGTSFNSRVLDFAVRVLGRNPALRQAALKNPGVSLETLEWLASNADETVIRLMLDNQQRLIRHPSIVLLLLSNALLSITQLRRIYDLSEQFFRGREEITSLLKSKFGLEVGLAGGVFKKEGEESIPKAAKQAGEEAEQGEGVGEELLGGFEEAQPESPTPLEDHDNAPGVASVAGARSTKEIKNLYQQILAMSVPRKVELALKGNKEARGLLIRDSNKIVQKAVLDSPKITDAEVENFAKMRSLSKELFRKIVENKEWVKRYPVLKGLATNPKVPPDIAFHLVPRLKDLDLRLLQKDKNVGQLIRREAKRIYTVRHTRKIQNYRNN